MDLLVARALLVQALSTLLKRMGPHPLVHRALLAAILQRQSTLGRWAQHPFTTSMTLLACRLHMGA